MPKHSNKAYDNRAEEMRGFLDLALAETKAVKDLKKEIASLQKDVLGLVEKNGELMQKNEELSIRMEENEDTIRRLKAAYNKMLSDMNSYEANTIIFSKKTETEEASSSARVSDGVHVFDSLKQKIDNFCSDSLLADAGSLTDESYYRYVARFYHSLYEWVKSRKTEDMILENLLEQFCTQKEASLSSGIYEKLKELVIAAQKSYQEIFCLSAANQYPKYELVYPKAGSKVGNEYEFIKEDKNPRRKKVKFCIYPGILEISHNSDTNEDKKIWRSKPVVWTD